MDEIARGVVDLEEPKVKELVERALKDGRSPIEVVEALRGGLIEVGKLYEERRYFLSDLIMATGICQLALRILTPHLKAAPGEGKGRVVIGTVEGSVHDMGKSIVIALLMANGYEVYDLGVNVPAEEFIKKIRETGARILGLSVGLTQALPSLRKVVKALEEAGLRDKVKVIVGGNAATEERAREAGCDAYAPSAIAGIRIIEGWAKELT